VETRILHVQSLHGVVCFQYCGQCDDRFGPKLRVADVQIIDNPIFGQHFCNGHAALIAQRVPVQIDALDGLVALQCVAELVAATVCNVIALQIDALQSAFVVAGILCDEVWDGGSNVR
jgi:hypothetical protein